MNSFQQFIKYVKLDKEKRILISLQTQLEEYLQDEQTRSMLKESAKSILKDDFVQLEIGKNICRVTVREGTEEKNLDLIKEELVKGIEMAMAFLIQMKNMNNQ